MCELPKGRAKTIVMTLALTAILLMGFYGVGYGASDADDSTIIFTITAPSYDVTFAVVDEEQEPIEGATVRLENGVSGEAPTGADGKVLFENVPPGTYDYTVSKYGYYPVDDAVDVVDDDVTVDVTLVLKTYTLDVDKVGEGTVTVDGVPVTLPFSETYDHGTEVNLHAIPDEPAWAFDRWLVNGEVIHDGTRTTITMVGDRTTTAYSIEVPPPPPPPPGDFEIWVPPLAGPETLEIGVTTREAEPEICQPRGPVDGLVFEVTAYLLSDDEESVEPSKFDEPVTVTLHWDEELDTEDAERILVHYYHELLKMWIPLPTDVDADNQTVSANITRPADLVMCIKDTFTDIDGHWGERYILFLSEVGFIDGYLDMTFRPNDLVTREQFAKMLVESAGLSPQFARWIDFLFNDAGDISDWARPYTETAALERLVLGFEDDTFRPHAAVTRAQVGTMISRVLGLTSVGEPPFADADEIPEWAAGHVAALGHLGIVRGYLVNGEYLFRPDVVTTRAEAAAFLTRYLEERLSR